MISAVPGGGRQRVLKYSNSDWKAVKNLQTILSQDYQRESNDVLRRQVWGTVAGRKPGDSAGLIVTQSVNSDGESCPERGSDGVKRIKWRKCHLLVDTRGWLITKVAHAADSVGHQPAVKQKVCHNPHHSES